MKTNSQNQFPELLRREYRRDNGVQGKHARLQLEKPPLLNTILLWDISAKR
ncbi:MAG: hypothetical protein UU48_C0021G0010, partial [Candidatus Uhrbacteria bacterium GW2011_GWF2_41_16]